MISEEVKSLARKIGQFYLEKNSGVYAFAEKDILNLRILKIDLIENCVVLIELSRPGVLIGKRGENLYALSRFLEKPIKVVEAEENILDYLVPQPSLYDVESEEDALGYLDPKPPRDHHEH
jgi:ribosomal protein S3